MEKIHQHMHHVTWPEHDATLQQSRLRITLHIHTQHHKMPQPDPSTMDSDLDDISSIRAESEPLTLS